MKSSLVSLTLLLCHFVNSADAQLGGEAGAIPDNPAVEIPDVGVDRTVIDSRTANPVDVLVSALEAANRVEFGKAVPIVVELCDVDLNLNGRQIVLGDDRSLVASPACARGPRKLGPRIYVTEVPPKRAPFVIRGDRVRFSGFRLEGPTNYIAQGDERKEFGIDVAPFSNVAPIRRIEISNMEIYHWSGGAIYLADNAEQTDRGRLVGSFPEAIRISDSYIHHNRHGDGYGYGVDINGGAYALIERSVFDENRHAIAGGSKGRDADYSGYTFRGNLILPGGGLHCSEHWANALLAWQANCWQTHQIDMHGDKSWWRLGPWCCGTAGETIIIEGNAIFYTGGDGGDLPGTDSGYAIKIRGNPLDKVFVDANVFRHGNSGDAIAQNGDLRETCSIFGWPCFIVAADRITHPIIVTSNNAWGVNPLSQIESCDFVGDGNPDEFLATGVSWWTKSSTTGQWRHLNVMAETMPQLILDDIDGDGKCDVAKRPATPQASIRFYSKGGATPWLPVSVLDPTPQ
jgi:hypothetical protein